jgi:hypothetical protein
LQRYRFALKTADFLLCGKCGVYIGATLESALGQFGIINTRALVPVPRGLAPHLPVDYERESVSLRVARRENRWSRARFASANA